MKELHGDLAIVGGGPAGICAALEAARLGLQTVLVHNRPVLGGNSSSEVRVWTRGAVGAGNLFSEEMGVLGLLKMRNLYANPDGNPVFWDEVLLDAALAQPGLTLLLNTHVTDLSVRDGRVEWVQGSQQASERTYRVRARMFLDATGDGTLGARAGVPYWVGDRLYDENAPAAPTGLLGSSILYYVKKEDHPVTFVPPDYAYDMKTVESLLGRGGRIISEQQSGSDCWWFEYGGVRNTIADAQDIAFELKRMVMGVWNYIKNSGKFDADCSTLEWVGSLPGKRESRRMATEYMLAGEDVRRHTQFADGGFYGGWYMDFHPAEGIGSAEDSCIQIPVNVYSVPLRCLYHRDFPNLLFAGRDIGTQRDAFVSTRVMNTCALSGQAAAALAWGCLRWDTAPAALAPEQIETIRQTLLREDMFLPGAVNRDPADLARDAAVTASSRYSPPAQPGPGSFDLTLGGFIASPCPEDATAEFRVWCAAPGPLRAAWYTSPLPSRLCPGQPAGEQSWELSAGENRLIARFPSQAAGQYGMLVFDPAPGTALLLAANRSPGVLCGRADRPEYADPFWLPGKNRFYEPANVVDGVSRIWRQPHLWCSAPEKEPWLELRWDAPRAFTTVLLYLDPDLSMELPSSHAHRWDEHHKFTPRAGMPPQLMRRFRLEVPGPEGWHTVARCKENWQRMVRLDTGKPVTATAVRLVCEETWGDERAHLFEMRVYNWESQPSSAGTPGDETVGSDRSRQTSIG